jgi:hypothetical protein
VIESVRVLMTELIDYAGLFPPAALPMKASVDNFDLYRRGEHAWMLNRFVVPAARLDEFLCAFEQLPGSSDIPVPWKLSAIVGSNAKSDIATIVDFNQRASSRNSGVIVEALELKAADPGAICQVAEQLPRGFESYFEIPCSNMTEACIRAIAEVGSRAKLRTGGDKAQMFPSFGEVADFLVACASSSISFKASAGLHHAVTGVHRYTYEPESASGPMHGFLNLFVAAAFARQGMNTQEIEKVLTESRQAFGFDHTGVRWNECHIPNEELASARHSFCLSFGSCSFNEPIHDLGVLGLL